MKMQSATMAAIAVMAGSFMATAQQTTRVNPLAKMPVKEVSIFKDGHAFVLHQGSFPVDALGNVVLDYLPTPVLGTFWSYSVDRNVGIAGMTAGQHRVVLERTALKLADLLEANIGADVTVTEKAAASNKEGTTYAATIVGVPRRSSAELEATSPPNSPERLAVRGELILLKTSEGVKAMPLDRIQDVIFKSAPKVSVNDEEFRNQLTLKMDWMGRPAARSAEVGLVYLQKGLRWIPDYRVSIDGKGSANVKLQATLVNELTDLEDATANLIVGVPTFAFKDTLDPLALQQTVQLSNYFQTNNDRAAMSNAIGGQMAARTPPPSGPAVDLGPVGDAAQNEDLFLFTIKHLDLKKGQRSSVPISESTLKYQDVYVVDLPFAPPGEALSAAGRGGLTADQQAELARLSTPRAAHRIRLVNSTSAPLTTAPALVLENDRVLAQGMITYTPIRASVDLDVTKAVDIQVSKSDVESGRTPNATRVNNLSISRVEMSGVVKLVNYRKDSVEVEVTRDLLGDAIEASNAGLIQKINLLESDRPAWWRNVNWPAWWNQMNGVTRITWHVTLTPGASADLKYSWRYYWQ